MKNITFYTFVAAVALCAEPLEFTPMQIVSSPLSVDELSAPEAVEIYTAEQISASHATSLYDFLNARTSLFTFPSYGNPLMQKLDLHGYGIGDGYQNLVITLDGRRLNNVDMVPQLLSAIAPSAIERIEIVKGSGIVTGGDGANAGAIHITTRRGSGGSLSAFTGIYSTFGAALQAGHEEETYRVSASGEVYRTDGTRHVNAAGERDAQKLGNGRIDLAVMPLPLLELRLGAQAARSDVTYGGYLSQAEFDATPSQPGGTNYGATRQRYDSDAYSAGITVEATSQLTLNVDAFIEKKKQHYVTYQTTAHYDYQSLRATAAYDGEAFSAVVGSDLFDGTRKQPATGYTAENKTTKRNAAGFLQLQYRIGGHTFKGGYRFEQVDYDYDAPARALSEGHTLHGAEAGYNYRIDAAQSVFAGYARGFQAPDVDRFFTADYSTTPASSTFNGFIQPMKTHTVTLGYNHLSDANRFKISAYYVDLQNEIYYYADPTYVASVNTNIDRSHKWGLDLSERWVISPQFQALINYNYVDAIIDEEEQNGEDFGGNTLPGVAAHTVKGGVTFLPLDVLQLTLTQLYRSRAYAMDDFGNAFSQRQQAIMSTDLDVTYEGEGYALFAKVKNLTNRKNGLWVSDDVIYPVNFTTTAVAGLKWVF